MEEQSIVQEEAQVLLSENQDKARRNEYMRNYMRNRYQKDPEKARQYRNTLRAKSKYEVSAEDSTRYGIYLADVLKLKKILAVIPRQHVEEVIREIYEQEQQQAQKEESNNI